MFEILKLMLHQDSEIKIFKICVRTFDMNSTLGSVVLLAMFYLNVKIQEKPNVETQLNTG